MVGVIKGDTRSLDYSSCMFLLLPPKYMPYCWIIPAQRILLRQHVMLSNRGGEGGLGEPRACFAEIPSCIVGHIRRPKTFAASTEFKARGSRSGIESQFQLLVS